MFKAVTLLGAGCLLGLSVIPRRRSYMRVQIETSDGWKNIGDIKSMIAHTADGKRVIQFGMVEDLFDLQMTDTDIQFLKDIDDAMQK